MYVYVLIYRLRPKLRNINLHSITQFLTSRNPREQIFVVQISLLIVTFLSLISQIMFLLMRLVECWCMHLPHHPRRSSGVDHTNGGERRMNPNFIVSHVTLILQ